MLKEARVNTRRLATLAPIFRIKGAGTLQIKAVSPTDREFALTGEVAVGTK